MRRIAIAGTVCTGLICFIGWHIANLPTGRMPVAAAQFSQPSNSPASVTAQPPGLPVLVADPGLPANVGSLRIAIGTEAVPKSMPAGSTASENTYPSTGFAAFELAAPSRQPSRGLEDDPRALTVADLKAEHPLARVITPAAARRMGMLQATQPATEETAAAIAIQRLPPVDQVSIAEPEPEARSLPQEPIAVFP